MAELLVIGFQGNSQKGSDVLDELRVLDDAWLEELADAIAIHRNLDQTVAMDQSYQPTGRRAAEWGTILGFLIGASLRIPFMEDACPLVAQGVQVAATLTQQPVSGQINSLFWAERLKVDTKFLDAAGELAGAGGSAVFAILDRDEVALASERFQGFGGTVLHLHLDSPQIQGMQMLLRG